MDTEESDVVTLLVSGREFQVSRKSLMANSDYFQAMFDGRFLETDSRKVELQGVENVDAFAAVLEFIVKGRINWQNTEPHLPDAFQVADMFCMSVFNEHVKEQLIRGWHEIEDIVLACNISVRLDLKKRVFADITSAVWEMFSFLGHDCESCGSLHQLLPEDIMLMRRDSGENFKRLICKIAKVDKCSYFCSKAEIYFARYCHEPRQLWLAFPAAKFKSWLNYFDFTTCFQGNIVSLTTAILKSFLKSPLWNEQSYLQGSSGYKDCERGFLRWLLQQDVQDDLVGKAVRCFRLECVPISQLKSLISQTNVKEPLEKLLSDLNATNKELVQHYLHRVCIVLIPEDETMYWLDTLKWEWTVSVSYSFKERQRSVNDAELGCCFSISPEADVLIKLMRRRSGDVLFTTKINRIKETVMKKCKTITAKVRGNTRSPSNILVHYIEEEEEKKSKIPVIVRLKDEVLDVDQVTWFVNNAQNNHLYYTTEYIAPKADRREIQLVVKRITLCEKQVSSQDVAFSEPYAGQAQNCQVIQDDSTLHGFVSFFSYGRYNVSHFVVNTESAQVSFSFSKIFYNLNVELSPLAAAWLKRGEEVMLLFVHGKEDLWLARYSIQSQALWPIGFLPPLPKSQHSPKDSFPRKEYMKSALCHLSVFLKENDC